VFVQTDHSISNTASQVLQTDPATGLPISDVPTTLIDNGSKTEWIESAYLQDEWKLIPTFTINHGLRLDKFTAYTSASHASPRISMVWQALADTTLHAGYARYLSPPPFELVGGKDFALFQNTTSVPLVQQVDSPLAERANYYDIGVLQKITQEFTVGVDTYYKQSHNLIDEGQFGAPIILTPFNCLYGKQYGAEFTANYTTPTFTAYFNFAAQSAKGKQIDSAQFNFAPADLAYIAQNYIRMDHEQQQTASGGVTYRPRRTNAAEIVVLLVRYRIDFRVNGVTLIASRIGAPVGAPNSLQITERRQLQQESSTFDVSEFYTLGGGEFANH
jgi:hypothetical protein